MTATPVLLPGNMCDARLWPDVVRHALSGAVDADLTRDATIAAMAARTLADSEGSLLPVGFSMGAIVALEMAHQAPDRIAGAVLLGLNAGPDLPERAAHRPVQQAEVRDGGLERVLVDELKPNYLAAERRGDSVLLALLRDMGMALGEDVFVAQSEALRLRADRRDVLRGCTVPVLFGCGEQDTLCPSSWHRDWAAMTARSSLRVFAGAGHMLPLERPEELAEAITDWIEKGETR